MSEITGTEIRQRIKNFQNILMEEGLKGALIMQNVDLYYFTGTIQPSLLFIPVDGDASLMVLKNYDRVRNESPLENILEIRTRNQALEFILDSGIDPDARLGLETDVLPVNHYVWLMNEMPQCRWTDISAHIRRLRMIKSEYEIVQIKKASAILHKGFTEIRGIIKKGMTELEVDSHLGFIARREGHMGLIRMRSWNQEMAYAHVLSGDSGSAASFVDSAHGGAGTTAAMAQGAGYRKIRKDEPILIDYGAAVNGYISDQTRTFVIGRLPRYMGKAFECSRKILDLLTKKALPGVQAGDLYQAASDMAESNNLGKNFMGHGQAQVRFVGHGLGLEIDEYPVVGKNFNMPLQEGMVIALEPKFVFPGQGAVGLEDDYVVTSSGLKRLTLTDQELVRL